MKQFCPELWMAAVELAACHRERCNVTIMPEDSCLRICHNKSEITVPASDVAVWQSEPSLMRALRHAMADLHYDEFEPLGYVRLAPIWGAAQWAMNAYAA